MTTPVTSIFDYTPEPEEGEPETHPLDGHYIINDQGKEEWQKREQKQCQK